MFNYTLKKQGTDIIDTVLTNRNLTLEEANSIMNATLEKYRVEACNLKNIDKAAEIFNNAIKNYFKIGILIDSDCDGYCSAAMIYDYITNKIGYKNVTYKFHEEPKGHGLQDYVIEWVEEEGIEISRIDLDRQEKIKGYLIGEWITDKETLERRITGRRICRDCKATYNVLTGVNTPKNEHVCDKCGGTLYQREDDNYESFQNRYQTYLDKTLPLVDYYKEKNVLYSVSSLKPEDTIKEIEAIIND